ncbi:hypothetical protein ACFQ9X_04335 [Catenulispora yoronensis]
MMASRPTSSVRPLNTLSTAGTQLEPKLLRLPSTPRPKKTVETMRA